MRSGWGQEYVSGDVSAFAQTRPGTPWDDFSGPIESWSNYRAITPQEWELFSEHQVVYSDGQNVDGLEAGWLVCGICSCKKTMSKDAMRSHLESAKHKRNFDWYRIERGGSKECSVLAVTEDDKRMLQEHRCVEQDDWIVCTLCSKKLMDMSYLPSHIATRKHMNNLEWAKSVEGRGGWGLPEGIQVRGDEEYYCVICDVRIAMRSLMDLHAESFRHRKNASCGRDDVSGSTASLVAGFDVPIRRGPTIAELKGSRPTSSLPDLIDI